MAKPKNTPQSRKGGQYSLGSIALTLILVLLYWWTTGTLPEGTAPEVAQAPAGAVTTTQPLPTTTSATATNTAAAIATAVTTPPPALSTAAPTEPAATAVTSLATATALPAPTATKLPPSTATATTAAKPTAPKPTATPTQATRAGPRGMATITLDELPPEALDTIDLIEAGGPFPFSRDGVTFQNREGLLPAMPRGYYSEYTVITPGENDRGARRIIAGEDGELYYTDDHYDSFAWILLP